ncbi:MAG: hypothetical protein WC792_05675 [Candidatus Micrarchaeia archaeon]
MEFFLVVGFSLALLAILVANAESQLSDNALVGRAVASSAALDSLSYAINFVFLQGNNSQARLQLFVPPGPSGANNATCFFNFSNTLACDVGDLQGRMAYSHNLLKLPSSVASSCFSSGWKEVNVSNRNNNILVSCAPIS